MTSQQLFEGKEVLPINGRSGKLFFLSPFHMFEFTGKDGQQFSCLEQHMEYSKAKFFEDDETAMKILQATTIKDFQRLGAKVKGFNAEKWTKQKYAIMQSGILHKFCTSLTLAKKLARTAGYTLAWCEFCDKFWSCGCKDIDPVIYHPSVWKGQNRYGWALMFVRDVLFNTIGPEYSETYREGVLNARFYPQSFVISRIEG